MTIRTLLFSVLLVLPALAYAQEPAQTFQGLQSSIHPGDIVRLHGTDGNTVKGTVESLTSSSLKLKVNSASREFREPQAREIQVRYNDSVKNGLTIGAVIGGISGAVIGAIVSDAFCDGCGNAQASGALAFGLLGTGIGAGTGGLSDYLKKGYKPVFKAQKVAGNGFSVSPVVSQNRKAVALAFRF